MKEPSIQEIWNQSSRDRKRQIVQVVLARSKDVHSDTIQKNTVIGTNPVIEAELSMLTRRPISTIGATTFGQLLAQLGLN